MFVNLALSSDVPAGGFYMCRDYLRPEREQYGQRFVIYIHSDNVQHRYMQRYKSYDLIKTYF